MEGQITYLDEVAAALAAGQPVVALESTIIAHGLPRPDNLAVARQVEAAVRDNGVVPATIGMVGGTVHVGLTEHQLVRLATEPAVVKLSVRDLGPAAVAGVDGATTVAATAAIARRAGIGVFATGGLGGVHRGAGFDESADLVTLARTPIVVVCAGVKSILDVAATLERLETLGVTVLGYQTRRFPGFFITDSGFDLDWSVSSPEEVAAVAAARTDQAVSSTALIVANPVPVAFQLNPARHDQVLAEGLAAADRQQITGKAVTPFVLAHIHAATDGRSQAVNVQIIVRNAALAAQIAVAAAVLARR